MNILLFLDRKQSTAVNDAPSLKSRLIEVEVLLMHLQHDFEHLNAECLRQQQLLKQQERRIEMLESALREHKPPGAEEADN